MALLRGFKSFECCLFRILYFGGSSFASSPAPRFALLLYLKATMAPPLGPRYLPNLMLDEARVQSDRGLDPRVSVKYKTSKLSMCCPGLDIQKTGFSETVGKRTRDARVVSIADAACPTQSSYRQEEQASSPLRLALARHSVKKQIFACMDQGDKKTEIESKTGLSHRCIKWHRRMWRIEGRHPRHRPGKFSKSSARSPLSQGTRSGRAVRRRQASGEKSSSSVAGDSSSEKRGRKHRVVRQSKGRCKRTGIEMAGSGGGECAEREARGCACFASKENVPERNAISGGLRILPIRALEL